MSIPITLQRHLTEQQKHHPAASGQFCSLLWEFVLAVKMIAREVRRAGLIDILGAAGHENVHGEKVQKLDAYAQDVLKFSGETAGNVVEKAVDTAGNVVEKAVDTAGDTVEKAADTLKNLLK